MDLAFLNTLTDAQRAALAILAEDLQNFGVSDSLTDTPIGLNNMVKAPKAEASPQASTQASTQATQAPAQTAAPAAKPTQSSSQPAAQQRTVKPAASMPTPAPKHSAKPFVLDDYLKVIKGTLPFTVVMNATDGTNIWSGAEQTLWTNMMRAMGYEAEVQPTFMLLTGDAADDVPLASNHEASLLSGVLQKLKDQPILVMGHRGLQLLSEGKGNAASVRRGDWELEKINNKGCFFTLVATYHANTLLRQPFLKRQTWADLLSLKQALKEGTK
ncbi:MAG: hypothetical protein CMF62_12110 [Magnetococcales bacterium]|nr:hypothetical protein [Magnetococcales bacterium]|tara:strand:- start:208688 stop:209503 length:816 start_codon:yes stop_codon:yes gene_type:complete